MTMDIKGAQENGFIKCAKDLKIKEEQEIDFKKGLIYEKVPELLNRGNQVSERRVELMEQRAEFSKYLILPTLHSFPKLVRIMSVVVGFITKARKGRRVLAGLLREGQLWFGVFATEIPSSRNFQEEAEACTPSLASTETSSPSLASTLI